LSPPTPVQALHSLLAVAGLYIKLTLSNLKIEKNSPKSSTILCLLSIYLSRYCKLYITLSLFYVQASLQLHLCFCSVGCYSPDWEVVNNQNSEGAIQYHAAQSVQECLDYCGSQSNCVAADVDLTKQPPTCWPHLSKDALRNVFSQQGTNQYRLKTRCADPITGCNSNSVVLSLYHSLRKDVRDAVTGGTNELRKVAEMVESGTIVKVCACSFLSSAKYRTRRTS